MQINGDVMFLNGKSQPATFIEFHDWGVSYRVDSKGVFFVPWHEIREVYVRE